MKGDIDRGGCKKIPSKGERTAGNHRRSTRNIGERTWRKVPSEGKSRVSTPQDARYGERWFVRKTPQVMVKDRFG